MAATGKPQRYTEKVLLTLTPEDLSKLNELAEMQDVTRLGAMRSAIREEHARLQRRKAKEPQDQ